MDDTEKVLKLDMRNLSTEDLEWLHELKNRAAVLTGRLQLKYLKIARKMTGWKI